MVQEQGSGQDDNEDLPRETVLAATAEVGLTWKMPIASRSSASSTMVPLDTRYSCALDCRGWCKTIKPRCCCRALDMHHDLGLRRDLNQLINYKEQSI